MPAGARVALAQTQVTAPGVSVGSARYGAAQPAEIWDLAAEMYLRRAVRTKGVLGMLDIQGHYYTLSDGASALVLIPGADFHGDLKSLIGRRVEVEGYVRRLVENQGTCKLPNRQVAPASYCENPELPPTPDLQGERSSWPRVSITTWYVGDLTAPDRKGGGAGDLIGDILDTQGASGKPVRVVGRFCGASLCGGLGPAPAPKAWVLADDVTAVWVIGKEPAGKGWRLDPAYPADTSRWLEVVGRVEPCGATRCLRAKSLALVPRRGASESDPPR
ncbi:MAG TPA: hypothetical protein VEQ84_18040 [Vicinamibacteria bacterium]|nr:hypothetical protein [Vicinamibacteria bacterium]